MKPKHYLFEVRNSARLWIRMIKAGVFASIMLASAGAYAQPMSGNYTVCNSGCNYSTINNALTDLKSKGVSGAVTINIAAGTYNESLNIPAISGVSATNTVTFRGKGPNSTKITTGSSSYTVYLNNSSYIMLEDMQIQNTGSGTRYGVDLYAANFNTIKNCIIIVPSYGTSFSVNYAVRLQYCGNNTFEKNRIEGGYYSFYIYNYSGSYSYKNNTYKNNTIVQTGYYPFYNTGDQGSTYEGNLIDSSSVSYHYGFYSWYESGVTYRNNVIKQGYYGLGIIYYPSYFGTVQPFTIVNNMIYTHASAYYGTYVYAYMTSNVNMRYYHNTIHMPGANGYNLYMYNYNSDGFDIKSNNFSRGSSGILMSFYNPASGNVDIDGNNYYANGGTLVEYGGSSYTDLASYQAAAVANGHSENDMSMAVAYKATGDLHYDQTVPAPSGVYAGVDIDMDGDARCKLFPSAGADESTYGKGPFKAKFFGPNPTYIQTPSVYYNFAKSGEPKRHKWYLNGTFMTDSIHFAALLTGPTAVIKLVTEGCAGKDSFIMSVKVDTPPAVPVTDFVGNQNTFLPGGIVKFSDLSTNGPSAWNWEISPDSAIVGGSKVSRFTYVYGTSSSQGPHVRFDQPGRYKVCMTASNIKGAGSTECKVDYIYVIPAVNFGDMEVIREAKGFLYDDGGANGFYNNGTYLRDILIDPCASEVSLIFNYFDLESGYDYLRIYDGKDNTGIPLFPCTTNNGFDGYGPGFTGPANSSSYDCIPTKTDTFVGKSGKLYIEMYIDPYVEAAGFEAEWWSTPKSVAAPTAQFTSKDSVCVNGTLNFVNQSSGTEVEYFWDLDGDFTVFESKDSIGTSWPYFFSGQVTATLIALNCGGYDTFTKTITVFDPDVPTADFSADNTNPTTNDIVFFTPDVSFSTKSSEGCVDDYTWTFTKKYGSGKVSFVSGSNEFSESPAVIFPDTGCWNVQLKAENSAGGDSIVKDCYIKVKNAYCGPSVANMISDLGISLVQLSTLQGEFLINNPSDQGVKDFNNYVPTISASVEIGVTYKLNVARKTPSNRIRRSVWIDWNLDGDFSDAQELVGEQLDSVGHAPSDSWSMELTIPTIAKEGASVMRIAVNSASQPNEVCGQNRFGEYEDYRLYISPDITAPVITRLGKDTVLIEQGRSYTDAGATALDNLDGDITSQVKTTQSPNFNNFVTGIYRFIYNVEDASGNKAIPVVRIVKVIPDTTSPTLLVSPPDTIRIPVNKNNPPAFIPPAVTKADDIVDGNLMGKVNINHSVNTGVVGTYTVTYSVADTLGNTTVVTRTVIVYDDILPSLILIDSSVIYHEVLTAFVDPGYIASDNYYDNTILDSLVVTANNVDGNKIGTYTVVYSLIDPSGNGPVTVTRTVIVRDTKLPVVILKGDSNIVWDVNKPYTDMGISASDNYTPADSLKTTVTGSFYTSFPNGLPNKIGKYEIIYCVEDESGNKTCVTRSIEVLDREAPVITLNGATAISICRWAVYTDEGYDLSDNYYDSSDITVTMEGTFVTNGTSIDGLYNLRYKAVDKSGNAGYSGYRYILVTPADKYPCNLNGISGVEDIGKYISIYPNPNSGIFTVKAELPSAQQVKISVVNLLGEEVRIISSGLLSDDVFTVDLSNEASGVYMLKVTSENSTITKRIVIAK